MCCSSRVLHSARRKARSASSNLTAMARPLLGCKSPSGAPRPIASRFCRGSKRGMTSSSPICRAGNSMNVSSWNKENGGSAMAVADDVLISMKDIKKIFYADEVETHALSGVNLEIRRGEYVCVAGPSGSGKSTLLAILGLLDSPSEGQYFLKNESVENLDVAQRAAIRNREIGFIFQSFNLIGDLSVYENVELPLTYRGMSNTERKRRGLEALSRVGMSHRTGHFPSQL